MSLRRAVVVPESLPDDLVFLSGLDCHIASLKTLINLSNDDQACAKRLCSVDGALQTLVGNLFFGASKWDAKADASQGPAHEDRAREYDVMVLIVGLLVNLAGLDPSCRDRLRSLHLWISCPGSAKCSQACVCPKRDSALIGLIDVFKRCRVASFASSGDPVGSDRPGLLLRLLLTAS